MSTIHEECIEERERERYHSYARALTGKMERKRKGEKKDGKDQKDEREPRMGRDKKGSWLAGWLLGGT
jgi:hypothetical protein